MIRRRRPIHGPTPPFALFGIVFILCMLLSTCVRAAEPAKITDGERMAYSVGVVAGAYYSYVGSLMQRLTAAGVPVASLRKVIGEGCSGVTLQTVSEIVLLQPPAPRTTAEAVIQTHTVLDRACASLSTIES